MIGIALLAAASLSFAIAHWNSIYDDAFIYLRYVRNLHAGCGLRFNCGGPPVEGFTGPLYLATLWAGSLFTNQLMALCQIVGVVSLIAGGALGVVTAAALPVEKTGRLPAVLAISTALVLALDPFAKLNANIGMETALAAAVFSLVGFAAVTERPRLLVFAAIAGMLVRPEGLLFVLALPILPSLRRPRYLLAAGIAIAAIVALRYGVFRALAPNTYYAKSGGTWRHAELGLAYIWDAICDFPLAMLAPLSLFGGRSPARIYLVSVAAVWMAFFLRTGGDTFEYSRMWFPLVPSLTSLALVGAFEVAGRLRRFALVVPPVLALATGGRAAIAHAIPEQHWNPRIVEWIQTGTYLREHYPHGSLVATVPIGAIGYFSSLPILDLVGLTDAPIAHAGRGVPLELLDKRWIGHERNFTEYVLERAPAVIVTTMHQAAPWVTLAGTRAGFWADWLLLQEIKAGRAPYHLHDAEVAPGDHLLMFERDAPSPTTPPFGGAAPPQQTKTPP
ncbi:MAG: hypothetical protein JWO36_7246 [Myxococcales bacterium]|nr:hypothetical protein [Myxococcales bacterium]